MRSAYESVEPDLAASSCHNVLMLTLTAASAHEDEYPFVTVEEAVDPNPAGMLDHVVDVLTAATTTNDERKASTLPT